MDKDKALNLLRAIHIGNGAIEEQFDGLSDDERRHLNELVGVDRIQTWLTIIRLAHDELFKLIVEA